MFHPHFCHLFFGTHDCLTDAMQLMAAFKVEQDLQNRWREERDWEEKERSDYQSTYRERRNSQQVQNRPS